jgi:hypothetical protein
VFGHDAVSGGVRRRSKVVAALATPSCCARLIEYLAQRIIKIVQRLGARVHHRAGNDPDRDEIVLARDARGVLVLGLVGHHPADQASS